MKIEAIKEPKKFTPITLKITFEAQHELDGFITNFHSSTPSSIIRYDALCKKLIAYLASIGCN